MRSFLTKWAATWPETSPEERYQEHLKDARSALEVAKKQPSSDDDAFDKNLDNIFQCIAHFQEVKASHETIVKPAEQEFQKAVGEKQESMMFELFDLFETETIERFIADWRQKRSTIVVREQTYPGRALATPESTVSRDAGAGSRHPMTTRKSYPRPPPKPSHETPYADPRQSLATQAPPANRRGLATPESTVSRDAGDSSRAPAAPSKRFPSPNATTQVPPSKRARANSPRSEFLKPLTDSSIEFDEVYQKGNAPLKHQIVEHRGYWYILQCKEHRRTFPKAPIKAACKHLNATSHGNLRLTHDQAIARLGTLVMNCSDDLAQKNNNAVQRALYDNMGQPLSSLSTRRRRLHRLDPRPGEVYCLYWRWAEQDQPGWYAFVVLPWDNCYSFGWDMTLKDTKLLDKIPESCEYNETTEVVKWKPAYRPGRSHHKSRQYPIIFFDDVNFPWNCASCWADVSLFERYDANDQSKNIRFKNQITKFIADMNARGGVGSGQAGGLEERPAGLQHRVETIPIQDTDSEYEEDEHTSATAGPSIASDRPASSFRDVVNMRQGQMVKVEVEEEQQYTEAKFKRTSPTLQAEDRTASSASSSVPHLSAAEMRDYGWSRL
ncbi:hypothetical protein FBEOM_3334 [Fusarium beomiforme]|uniref:Uncharacterized protein n=1 Tax=Fusarium beomiforme TaxID=44412 RepID=A0A9P5APW6_9HYPO|nr:hypothetical protein FBEOM_3334 [Fusarium beomiforme]